MKLKTSCFKAVTLKKDILRFAPIWALYLIGMLMVFMGLGRYSDYDNFARNNLSGAINAFSVINLCYAGLIAAALFGDLYNTKLCYSLHAMPCRRESWLATHLLSGLLFSLVPNVIACCYLMVKLEAYWFLGLFWLLAATLQFIFFYGIATVSALLTGNRFAMLLVYMVCQFLSMLIYVAVELIYLPMLTGVAVDIEDFSRFCPAVQLLRLDYFQFTKLERSALMTHSNSRFFYRYDGLGQGWGYMAIWGVVGLAAMALSFWLYRKRHLESAGDFIAFPRLKGIACAVLTLCVTLCFAFIGSLFASMLVWSIVGLIVGFFGSLMLLERQLKVFRKRTFLGAAVMLIAVILSIAAIGCDWFGIEGWTPKADRVESVTVANGPDNAYYNVLSATLKEEEDISQIIAAHTDILERLDAESFEYHTVYLTYKMKSGRTVVRNYHIPNNGKAYEIIRNYLYQTDNILGFTDPKEAAGRLEYLTWEEGSIPTVMYEQVMTALKMDCENGHVDPDNEKGVHYIEYRFIDEEIYRYLCISPEAEHIIALLNSPECKMGYTDWESFLASVEDVHIDNTSSTLSIPQSQWEELLTAIRIDIEAGTLLRDSYNFHAIVYYSVPTDDGIEYRQFFINPEAESTMSWLKEAGLLSEALRPQ